jgi:hypothetical protein
MRVAPIGRAYVVIQEGVYRHKIIGAWFDMESAKKAAEAAITAEPDDYHNYQVVEVGFGVAAEEKVVWELYPLRSPRDKQER